MPGCEGVGTDYGAADEVVGFLGVLGLSAGTVGKGEGAGVRVDVGYVDVGDSGGFDGEGGVEGYGFVTGDDSRGGANSREGEEGEGEGHGWGCGMWVAEEGRERERGVYMLFSIYLLNCLRPLSKLSFSPLYRGLNAVWIHCPIDGEKSTRRRSLPHNQSYSLDPGPWVRIDSFPFSPTIRFNRHVFMENSVGSAYAVVTVRRITTLRWAYISWHLKNPVGRHLDVKILAYISWHREKQRASIWEMGEG